MNEYLVRPIRGDEWREIRALRLKALKDEDAPLAFVESYEEGAAQPDEFWQGAHRVPPATLDQRRGHVSSSRSPMTAPGWERRSH